jgi:glycosyltransferase involved in cell wall biosynthesis
MAAASVFVLPSVRETYPMSVLEAMSVGLPVVVTDDCGLAPLVDRTQCGVVTDPGARALAAAVESSWRIDLSPGPWASERGKRYGPNLVCAALGDRFVDVYTELVDGRH